MVDEKRLNRYGQDFDFDTETVYVKINGEVKGYKLTETQLNVLFDSLSDGIVPRLSLERLSDVCEKLASDKNYGVGMALSGLSYDYDVEKGLVTINIDLGDKINSYTISKEDFDVIKETVDVGEEITSCTITDGLDNVVKATSWETGKEPLLPLEELDDKLRKFTAGEVSIDSINVAGFIRSNIYSDDALVVIADESEMAVDSLGQLMWPEERYCRYDGDIISMEQFEDGGWDESDNPLLTGEAVETNAEKEIAAALASGHEVVIDEQLDLGAMPYADRLARAIVALDAEGLDVRSQTLLEEAKECVGRRDAIDNYWSTGKGDAFDTYMSEMKREAVVSFNLAEAESSVLNKMVSSEKFFIDDIKEAVRENSPLAIGEYGKVRADWRVDGSVELVNVARYLRNVKIAEFDLQRMPKKMNVDNLYIAAKKEGMEKGLGNVGSERFAVNIMLDNKVPAPDVINAVLNNSPVMIEDLKGVHNMVESVLEEKESLAAKQTRAKEQLEKNKERQEAKAKTNQNEGTMGSGGKRKGENSGFGGGR